MSSGFDETKRSQLIDELQQLAQSLRGKYLSLKMGLSTFVDKPIAYLGWSNEFGGHPDTLSDWCYRREVELTADIETFTAAFENAVPGAGVDVLEGQYEGILRAALDPSFGWSSPSLDYLADGSSPLRIMVLFTDSNMHQMGDGQKGLDLWASQYGTQEWCDMPVITDKELCAEAVSIKPSIEAGTADSEQEERWRYIQTILGPTEFPAMKIHPGDLLENEGCTAYDYPDWTYMVSVLENRKINPIYALLSESDAAAYNNWLWLSEQYVDTNITSRLVYQPSLDNLSTILDGMIGEISESWCQTLPPPLDNKAAPISITTAAESGTTKGDAETLLDKPTATKDDEDGGDQPTTKMDNHQSTREQDEKRSSEQECLFSVEFAIVLDTSSSEVTQRDLPFLADSFLSLSKSLSANYPRFQMALTTFVDKPIAYLGYSSEYGGHPDFPTDWCYRQVMPFTEDFVSLTDSIRNLTIGGGADPKEAQYEGILRTVLDTSLGWTNATVDRLEDGTIPLRVLFMLTDSAMHLMGDGPASLEKWANDYGTQAWCDEPIISDKELCAEAVALRPSIDDGSATEEQLERWAYIQTVLGPVEFPPMKVHPGNLTGNDGCTEYDYPDWPYLVDVLEQNQINPIYFIYTHDEDVVLAWRWLTNQYKSVTAHYFYNVAMVDITQLLEHVIIEKGWAYCSTLLASKNEKV